MTLGPFGPNTFLIRIDTSGVNIRTVLKKIIFIYHLYKGRERES